MLKIRFMFSHQLLCTFLLLSSPTSLSLPETSSSYPAGRRLLLKTPKNVIQQYLAPHNRERASLGLPPLKWSNKLANFAALWAHRRREDCELLHSESDYGENLFWGSGKDWKPGDAVAAWAEERCYYNHYTNSCSKDKDCLHYTQMIWRQTTKVGCANVVCKSGDTFITCNYDPHGNVIGQKPF